MAPTEMPGAAAPAPSVGRRIGTFQLGDGLRQSSFAIVLGAVFAALVVSELARKGLTETGDQLLIGMQRGAIYALVAVGYTMVYGIIELINFAHGDVFAISAFYSVLFSEAIGKLFHLDISSLATSNLGGLALALLIMFPLTMGAAGMTGVVIERVAYRRLRDAPRLAPLITAIGVSFFLEGIMFAAFGSGDFIPGKEGWVHGAAVDIGGVRVGWADLFVIGVAISLMFALSSFVRVSRLGKAMRATAQDRDAALLSGININRTISATFFIGSALAGAGALVYSIYYNDVRWDLGFRFGIIAFTAAVLGGIGNIVGAGLGGFLIGLIAVFGSVQPGVGFQWENSIVFIMLIIVLTFRPTGLLGMRVPDRA